MHENLKLDIKKLGKINYEEALKLQYDLLKKRQDDKINDTLLFIEHPHVFTMGRRADDTHLKIPRDKIKEMAITIADVKRGGEVTYHGPGQLVCYTICKIKSVKDFVCKLEEVTIRLLNDYFKIKAMRHEKHRGVWIGKEKITAVGIEIKKHVTMHGFAFNVNTDLKYFDLIIPCGITDMGVTSLSKILGYEENIDRITDLIVEKYCDVFGYKQIKL